jgi:phosphomevalonate kinase
MLADIDAGSHTPTLVGKVLAWKKAKPEEGKKLRKQLGSKRIIN